MASDEIKELAAKVKAAKMDIKIGFHDWTQIGGDMNPGTYGATIAKCDSSSIELLKIQPTREYVGDKEAANVGFPFWTRKACFDLSDLDLASDDVKSAMACVGLEALDDIELPEWRAMAIAEALLDYGHADEGPSGWAKDVVSGAVRWWGSKRARGWRFLASEDVDFRQMVREG